MDVCAVRPTGYMEDLPDDLLLKVFSYLPVRDLVRISRVCHRWKRVMQDRWLWRHVDLSECSIQPKDMYHLLDTYMAPHMESLRLKAYIYTGGDMMQLSITLMRFLMILCPQLWHLSLHEADLSFIPLCAMPLTLRSLELHDCAVTDDWLLTAPGALVPALERLVLINTIAYLHLHLRELGSIPSLRSLVLIRPHNLSEWSLDIGLPELRHLEYFALLFTDLSTDIVLSILTQHLTRLRRLCVNYGNLSPVGLKCLSELPDLERLTLVGPVMSPEIPNPHELLFAFLAIPKLNTLEMVWVNLAMQEALEEFLCKGLPACKVIFNPCSKDFWM